MAEKKFGGIELGETFGGYEIVNVPADKLPQDAASAVSAANSNPLLGATYNPIWYWGKQTVNGVNHLFVAEDIRSTKNKDKSIVGLVINVPPGEGSIRGEGAKIVRVIDGEKLKEEVEIAFQEVVKELKGMSYKPVMYIGKQIVRGENHYILCEVKVIYPGAQPQAVILAINIFEGKSSVAGILPIKAEKKDAPTLFGYAFTW